MKTALKWIGWIIAAPFIFIALNMFDDWMESWKLITRIGWMIAVFAICMGYAMDAQFKALHKAIEDLKGRR